MYQLSKELKSAQNSIEIPRYRNFSFKNEKSYQDHFHIRRKSLLLSEMKDQLEGQQSIQKSSFLPKIKVENHADFAAELGLIFTHFKLCFDQFIKQNNTIQYLSAMWEYYFRNGDIYDTLAVVGKLLQNTQIMQDLQDICVYEKVAISLGIEIHSEELFQQFFSNFVTAYQLCLQELHNKMKFKLTLEMQGLIGADKPIRADQIRSFLNNKMKSLAESYVRLNVLQAQNTGAIWQILKKCRTSQSYKMNVRQVRRLLALWLHETRNPEVIKYLPKQLLTAQAPFLSQIYQKPILAIDLDETLVHYEQATNKLLVRNYCLEFLSSLHKVYTIIIWTASLPRYAKWALKKIDNQIEYLFIVNSQHVDILLTREYCIPGEKGQYIKQIGLLGPDVNKIMIIENEARNISEGERDNSIIVEAFLRASDNDQILYQLCERLVRAYTFYQEGYCLSRALKMTYIK